MSEEDQATTKVEPKNMMPDGVGETTSGAQEQAARPPSIETIREWYSQRKAANRMQYRLDNAARAYARTYLGWQVTLPEKDRTAINKDAEKIVKKVAAAVQLARKESKVQKKFVPPVQPDSVPDAVWEFVLTVFRSRQPWDELCAEREKFMQNAAKQMPVYPFIESVKGLGALGLAIIVGEAGDLSGYANPAKLWKRMGLAPKGAYEMFTDDGKVAYAVPKQRRSAMWTIGDSLLKQGNGYRELYLERKVYEAERDPEMTKMHAHRRAQRYMEKRMLRDLWRAWRDMA